MSDIILKTNETRERIYTATAGQTDFSVPFHYENAAGMGVTVTPVEGAVSTPSFTMVPPSNYGSEENPGILRLTAPLAGGERVVVFGATPAGRVTSLSASQGNPSTKLNQEYSNLQKQVQEMKTRQARAISHRPGESMPDLPALSSLLGKLFWPNSSGTGWDTMAAGGFRDLAEDLAKGAASAVLAVSAALAPIEELADLQAQIMALAAVATAIEQVAENADNLASSELVNVRAWGALGTYDPETMTGPDDYAAILAAKTFAESVGIKRLYFPPGKYGMSQPLQLAGDDWVLDGVDMNASILCAINDDNLIEIDCRTAMSYRGTIANLGFRRRSASYSNTCAVRVLCDPAVSAGLSHWTFRDIMGRGVERVVYFEAPLNVLWSGVRQISPHAFCKFVNIHVPLDFDGRYPYSVIEWASGNGPHHLILGGQFRSREASVKMGDGGELSGVGDFVMTGVHCVLGKEAVRVLGPTGVTTYRYNFSITACQFDVLTDYLLNFENAGLINALGNNFTGLTNRIVNCTNYSLQDDTGIKRNGTSGRTDIFDILTSFQKLATFTAGITMSGGRFTRSGGFINLGTPVPLTLDAAGAITLTGSYHTVDTYEGAASDELVTINGGIDGDELTLVIASNSRTILAKHNTGNVRLSGKADFNMNSVSDVKYFLRRGGVWCEKGGSGDNFT